ncbi:MAG: DsbA family protein [Hahellaceae bacterium]|nr:DsbA family protein [Hahellaceae bacterium]
MSNISIPVKIDYFSDVLCVWAYVGQIRLQELLSQYEELLIVEQHFMPVFGCTRTRIGEGWRDRGGFDGFCQHVLDVGAKFPHVPIHPEVWNGCKPRSSAAAHLFIKAVQIAEQSETSASSSRLNERFERFVWAVRCAFFQKALDISDQSVLRSIALESGVDLAPVDALLASGEAMAALCRDAELKELWKIEGSPTFYLNQGRQKLYGNVGYKILEANVVEAMNQGGRERASWC